MKWWFTDETPPCPACGRDLGWSGWSDCHWICVPECGYSWKANCEDTEETARLVELMMERNNLRR